MCMDPPKQKRLVISYKEPLILFVIFLLFLIPPVAPQEDTTPLIFSNAFYEANYDGIDRVNALVQTTDGGFALAGSTYGGMWLVKTDANGVILWNKTYGGSYASTLVQTTDGGFALAGIDSYEIYYKARWILVKTDENGNFLWNQTIFDKHEAREWRNCPSALIQTTGGGFVLAGTTPFVGPDANADIWLVQTDADGLVLWNQTYGGPWVDEASSLIQTADGGFAIAGKTCLCGAAACDMLLVKTDENGVPLWNQTFEGPEGDYASDLVQTTDGGFAFVGTTWSDMVDGLADVCLVKTDANGVIQWNRTYEETGIVHASSLVQTQDGGFALAGTKYGSNSDIWVAKTETNGEIFWSQTYGGIWNEEASTLIETTDGGLAFAGTTSSFGAGGVDMWLVKTNMNGVIEWHTAYGGTKTDDLDATNLIQTPDGGFTLAGVITSYGVGGPAEDICLVKTDTKGTMTFMRTYGKKMYDETFTLIQTSDGGFALAGITSSSAIGGGYGTWISDPRPWKENPTDGEMWLVKTNANGVVQWNQTYGKINPYGDTALLQTIDGGFALVGTIKSSGTDNGRILFLKVDSEGKILCNQTYRDLEYNTVSVIVQTVDGGFVFMGTTQQAPLEPPDDPRDIMLMKIDANGTVQWSQTYGELDDERTPVLVQTIEGEFLLAGATYSEDPYRQWFLRLTKINSTGVVLWSQDYRFLEYHFVSALIQTEDRGFALTGGTIPWGDGNQDISLVKFNENGAPLWSRTYEETGQDLGSALVQTADGGFAIVGSTTSYGAGDWRMLLVKTDASGWPIWIRSYGKAGSKNLGSLGIESSRSQSITNHRTPGMEALTTSTVIIVLISKMTKHKRNK